MSKVLEQLRQLITASTISPADQNDLLIFLPILPEEALEDIIKIFQKNPKLILDFNEDFKARLNVLINGRDKWDKLIAQEEEMLKRADEEEEEY